MEERDFGYPVEGMMMMVVELLDWLLTRNGTIAVVKSSCSLPFWMSGLGVAEVSFVER